MQLQNHIKFEDDYNPRIEKVSMYAFSVHLLSIYFSISSVSILYHSLWSAAYHLAARTMCDINKPSRHLSRFVRH